MTGREFIIFILENHLEDAEIFEGGTIPGYLTIEEAALKLGTGIATIEALYELGKIHGVRFGDIIYIKDFGEED